MKQKNSPTVANEASRSRRGRGPVSRPLFCDPQKEAEIVAKKVIRRLMQSQPVRREVSDELREAYRRERMNQKLPEIQNAVFRVARLVFSDGRPRTRKAIDYFLCAACGAPWTFDYDATAFLKDSTTYNNKTCVDALISVGFRMFVEPMNLAEIRAAVQKEVDNGKRK